MLFFKFKTYNLSASSQVKILATPLTAAVSIADKAIFEISVTFFIAVIIMSQSVRARECRFSYRIYDV